MTNKIALVTGGSRGLGRNTALHLAEKGVGVVLTFLSRSEEASVVLTKIENLGGRAAAFQLNRGDTAQLCLLQSTLPTLSIGCWDAIRSTISLTTRVSALMLPLQKQQKTNLTR